MKNRFNNEHTLKSSENCDKFSKSVSVEKWLQISPVLRLVKVLGLVAVLSFKLISESWADTNDINCKTGQQSCGTNCCWSVDGSTLKITGGADGRVGEMRYYGFSEINNGEYKYLTNAPWKDSGVTSVDVQGVKNIGDSAFMGLGLTEANISDTVTTISQDALWGNKLNTIQLPDSITNIRFGGLNNSVNQQLDNLSLPDSVTLLGQWAVYGIAKTIIVPDTLTDIYNTTFASGVNIICKGSKSSCQNLKNKLSKYCPKYHGCTEDQYVDLSERFSVAGYAECASTNYFWDGDSCVREPDVTKRKCCDSCKDVGGWCNRIRYTPAEAAQVLKNDNTNEVTITFKK